MVIAGKESGAGTTLRATGGRSADRGPIPPRSDSGLLSDIRFTAVPARCRYPSPSRIPPILVSAGLGRGWPRSASASRSCSARPRSTCASPTGCCSRRGCTIASVSPLSPCQLGVLDEVHRLIHKLSIAAYGAQVPLLWMVTVIVTGAVGLLGAVLGTVGCHFKWSKGAFVGLLCYGVVRKLIHP